MSSPVQSHLDNFVVNVTLGLLPTLGFILNFSKVLIVTTLADSPLAGLSGVTTIGDNSTKIVTIGETTVIPSSGAVSADTLQVIQHFFGAKQHPTTVKILCVDKVGGDTNNEAAILLRDRTEAFHAVIARDNTQAEIASIVTAFNQSGMSHPVFAGVDATDAKGGGGGGADPDGIPDAATSPRSLGLPALDALADGKQEQLYLTYHDENGATDGAADFAEVCALYASVDWDNLAAGGNLILTFTKPLGIVPGGQATKDLLDDNFINHALPMFGTRTYVDAGVMFNGRPVYHIYTRDWLENRLQLAAAEVKAYYANLRMKLPMDSTGQTQVLNKLKGVMANGLRAQHTLRGEEAVKRGKPAPFERAEDITDGDIAAQTMRFSILAYFLEDARKITVNAFVTS